MPEQFDGFSLSAVIVVTKRVTRVPGTVLLALKPVVAVLNKMATMASASQMTFLATVAA